MSEHDFLPSRGLPATYLPANRTFQWFDMDTRELFDANGRPGPYGEHDIVYRFNAHGYRGSDFDQPGDLRVVAVGCSYVMGTGLPQSALFHERFAERLRSRTDKSVVLWNLGLPGASNDYINRILHLAVPFLDPDIVLVNFTHASRREYVSVQGRLVGYNAGWYPPDLVERDIHRHFEALSSSFDDDLNLFRNYCAIASLLADRCWLFSTVEPEALERIRAHIDTSRYAGNLDTFDVARDQDHPGPESHAILEGCYWSRYVELFPETGVPERRRAATGPVPATVAAPGRVATWPVPSRSRFRPLVWLTTTVAGLLRYRDFRLRRAARIRDAKEKDPNTYPLW